ncbi:gamma-glutamylcyclotransferase [Echinicola soli]|uniref:Gamma-glutamylcyclotransferase n=1 Tax=Echinicola soli TaxID=2591634 RepID=A0A514CEL4_9BACT|nr:gamma-glutamylcyclotransferase family protein [Echinicola soli]QDH78277.1 gamma-glutamylcyclotransferase [Echinicola soli]
MSTRLYFGYASNLDQDTLVGRLQHPPKLIGIGVLLHHGFRFNHPNPDGSARANIVPSPNENVYGAVYEIAEADVSYFLTSEEAYDFTEVRAQTQKGEVPAFTFISKQNVSNIFPEQAYFDTIIRGGKALQLPSTYLTSIMNRLPNELF